MKTRRNLFFVLTALLITVCRCHPDPLSVETSPITFADGSSGGSCITYSEILEGSSGIVYECSIACPDGTVAKFDLSESERPYSLSGLGKGADYQAKYCSAEAMVSAGETLSAPVEAPTSTETPTPIPTDTPTESAPIQAPLLPVLAGNVTVCDTGLGYINFPLVDPLPDLTGKSVSVLLNGSKVNCRLAGTGNKLLGCSLPAGTIFPLNVSAAVDGAEVNNFSFDGAICTRTAATKEADTDEDQPTPLPPPVDCDVNPDPFEC